MKTIALNAFQLAHEIDLKAARLVLPGLLLVNQKSELFYKTSDDAYLYIFDYGIVAFGNATPEEQVKLFELLAPYCENISDHKISEQHRIVVEEGVKMHITNEELQVPVLTDEVVRIAMFTIAQSTSLDFYVQKAEQLLAQVRQYTSNLEMHGKIKLSKKAMLKFIGKSLNIKNSIIENLYIFESPNMVWENEYLEKISRGMTAFFEIESRFKELEYNISYIDDNLEVFRDLIQHRESSTLEWIIIILILVEVFDLFFGKMNLF